MFKSYTPFTKIWNLVKITSLVIDCIIVPISAPDKNQNTPGPVFIDVDTQESMVALIGCYLIISFSVLSIVNGIILQTGLHKSSITLLRIWVPMQVIIAAGTVAGGGTYIVFGKRGRGFYIFVIVLIELYNTYRIKIIRKLIRDIKMIREIEEEFQPNLESKRDDHDVFVDQQDQDRVDMGSDIDIILSPDDEESYTSSSYETKLMENSQISVKPVKVG